MILLFIIFRLAVRVYAFGLASAADGKCGTFDLFFVLENILPPATAPYTAAVPRSRRVSLFCLPKKSTPVNAFRRRRRRQCNISRRLAYNGDETTAATTCQHLQWHRGQASSHYYIIVYVYILGQAGTYAV